MSGCVSESMGECVSTIYLCVCVEHVRCVYIIVNILPHSSVLSCAISQLHPHVRHTHTHTLTLSYLLGRVAPTVTHDGIPVVLRRVDPCM
jgi:hypothetical protein